MSKRIHDNFSRIYTFYGTMNHILSFGIDTVWRDDASNEILSYRPRSILDIATGTGDLALDIWKKGQRKGIRPRIVGIDFNRDMLSIARARIRNLGANTISVEEMDAMKLGYPKGSFDLVTSGFAIRNIDNLDLFLKQVYRVLRPGGKVVFLDMAMPDGAGERSIFRVYLPVMRGIGALVDKEAYGWLVESIEHFDKKAFAAKLRRTGFKDVRMRELASGVAYILTATR